MPNQSERIALVLVGGRGTRLQSIVSDRCKPMALVAGRPFLTYLLDQLIAAGTTSAVLCTGHLADQVRGTLGDAYGGLKLRYSQETQPLGTGGAVRQAVQGVTSNPVLVLNGDSYYGIDLDRLWRKHLAGGHAMTMALKHMPDTDRFGRVMLDDQNAVIGFAEKQPGAGPGWINAGIYAVNRALLDSIPPNRAVSLEREMFPQWMAAGMHGYRGDGEFIDIGTPESYSAAERLFSRG